MNMSKHMCSLPFSNVSTRFVQKFSLTESQAKQLFSQTKNNSCILKSLAVSLQKSSLKQRSSLASQLAFKEYFAA